MKLITFKGEDGVEYKIGFVVSKYRKYGSVNDVIRQMKQCEQAKLSPYVQSLFEACFKGGISN
ncbi:hypothetical protein ACA30_13220 [Virgibacillus soli]|nr:hypothetical protein ACA30_13220 [Virgibacillus soli]